MTTRILLADDQEGIRDAFRMVLDAQPDMQVVGEAADGLAALDLAATLRPDVVLADIRMPKLDGLELTRRLSGEFRVVVVTTFDLDSYVHEALRGGACGFLLKRSGPTLLVEAVRAAMAGDTLISPQITVRLLRHLSDAPPDPRTSPSPSANGRSPAWWRREAATPRSGPSCSSAPARPRTTWRTSSASWASATGWASRAGHGRQA